MKESLKINKELLDNNVVSGVVVSQNDPKNANRLQVYIPTMHNAVLKDDGTPNVEDPIDPNWIGEDGHYLWATSSFVISSGMIITPYWSKLSSLNSEITNSSNNKIPVGTICYISFINGDTTDPLIIGVEQSQIKINDGSSSDSDSDTSDSSIDDVNGLGEILFLTTAFAETTNIGMNVKTAGKNFKVKYNTIQSNPGNGIGAIQFDTNYNSNYIASVFKEVSKGDDKSLYNDLCDEYNIDGDSLTKKSWWYKRDIPNNCDLRSGLKKILDLPSSRSAYKKYAGKYLDPQITSFIKNYKVKNVMALLFMCTIWNNSPSAVQSYYFSSSHSPKYSDKWTFEEVRDRYINAGISDSSYFSAYPDTRVQLITKKGQALYYYIKYLKDKGKLDEFIGSTSGNNDLQKRVFGKAGSYSISSDYGEIRLVGSSPHVGVDYPCPTGTKLYAVTDGTICSVGSFTGSGNKVTIKCKEKTGKYKGKYYYVTTMHMMNQTFPVKKGDKVKKGDYIGKSGNTGNSTAPHLHIQILRDSEYSKGAGSGTPEDPKKVDWSKRFDTSVLKDDPKEKKSITITYNSNGGTPSSNIQVINASNIGISHLIIPKVSRKNKSLKGWYNSIKGGSLVSNTTIPTKSTTYYAQWS